MDVYLIPTATPEQYELYYEAPEDEPVVPDESAGLFQRWKHRFAEMLREAEEWRHRREPEAHEDRPGLLGRLKRKVMGFVVERIAEQRLLWHLRHETEVRAQIPTDMYEEDAVRFIRVMLKKDADYHFRWLLIDLTLLIASAPLVVVPGPNIPGFYFTFQIIGHILSMRGAKQGLTVVKWTVQQNPALTELREALRLAPPQRVHRVHELAALLHLPHLPTFVEQVAAP